MIVTWNSKVSLRSWKEPRKADMWIKSLDEMLLKSHWQYVSTVDSATSICVYLLCVGITGMSTLGHTQRAWSRFDCHRSVEVNLFIFIFCRSLSDMKQDITCSSIISNQAIKWCMYKGQVSHMSDQDKNGAGGGGNNVKIKNILQN